MFLAVVGFYDIIPKLYNMGLKENPDEVKTEEEQKQEKAEDTADTKSKDVPFTGAAASVNRSVAKKVMNTGWLKKISDEFEFNGPSMSVTAMSTLLFAFVCRLVLETQRTSMTEKKLLFVILQASPQSCLLLMLYHAGFLIFVRKFQVWLSIPSPLTMLNRLCIN